MEIYSLFRDHGGINLNQLQIATLMAIHQEVGVSTNAHIPLTSIHRHFPKHLRGFCKSTLRELVRLGLVKKHPTGGSMTYSLTIKGVDIIRKVLKV